MQSLNNDSGILGFIGKRMSKSITFLDGKLTIFKLTVAEVDTIQGLLKAAAERAKANEASLAADPSFVAEEENPYELVHTIVSYGVENGASLTLEALKTLPLEEVSKLSEMILEFSGVKDKEKKS
jgi:hypothetical protein